MGLVRVRVRVRVMVKVRVMVRFRIQKCLGFDPWRHSEPFIWETYRSFYGITVIRGDRGVAIYLIGHFVIRWGCGHGSNNLRKSNN